MALIQPLFEKEHLACFRILNRTGLSVYICGCELVHLHTNNFVWFSVCVFLCEYVHKHGVCCLSAHRLAYPRLLADNAVPPVVSWQELHVLVCSEFSRSLWSIGRRQIDIGTGWFTVALHGLFAQRDKIGTHTNKKRAPLVLSVTPSCGCELSISLYFATDQYCGSCGTIY